jgi:hypothetical protein
MAADDVADAVDDRVEPGFAQPARESMPRLDIDRRIGRAMDAAFVTAEFGEPPQIGDDALSVDGRHAFCALAVAP